MGFLPLFPEKVSCLSGARCPITSPLLRTQGEHTKSLGFPKAAFCSFAGRHAAKRHLSVAEVAAICFLGAGRHFLRALKKRGDVGAGNIWRPKREGQVAQLCPSKQSRPFCATDSLQGHPKGHRLNRGDQALRNQHFTRRGFFHITRRFGYKRHELIKRTEGTGFGN